MDNASARNMWGDYLDNHLEDAFAEAPKTVHFYDNEKDANECVQLVKTGIKRATSHSLLGLQYRKEPLPKIGDFTVVTDWDGKAQCILRTTSVKLKPYFSIDEEYAKLEGEGDKNLAYWKKVHWDYFTRELAPYNRVPRDSMIVVCEVFEKVFERK
ncbi:ASCH domain-containing protein [Maribacter sp. TH_r10]|uniref:ASCH domain-containing protein n=1 Tax=Maribacter luteus TaxID=2594478 RepID=A0A6I2MPI8_9FLAO|nr:MULTISPECIES: ASCH domain-containing protein [Maribacter]MDV7137452.1 ASCH domain-containing protein [Maribacter sp. TH_r10]MRX64174.1 ASCH domain-containing protein [Maribacter luteus]